MEVVPLFQSQQTEWSFSALDELQSNISMEIFQHLHYLNLDLLIVWSHEYLTSDLSTADIYFSVFI